MISAVKAPFEAKRWGFGGKLDAGNKTRSPTLLRRLLRLCFGSVSIFIRLIT